MQKWVQSLAFKFAGSGIYDSYKQFKRIQCKDDLITFRQSRLVYLLNYAYENVPYYHDHLKDFNVTSSDSIDLANFHDIPLLTKEIIRSNQQGLVSNDYQSRKWCYNTSGGSTGEPVKFIQDNIYSLWRNLANHYYYHDILGIDWYKVRKVNLWGSLNDISKSGAGAKSKPLHRQENMVFLNSFRMSERDMQAYIDVINSYKPDLIHGYAGSLYELSKFAVRNNRPLYSPRFVISSAETLRDDMREGIEEAFGTKVCNFYGSREVSNLAGECAHGLMHTFDFWNYLEILDENNRPVKVGEEGKVVVTNLFNYSMPLIRYEIGDLAIRGPDQCSCGHFLPTLKKVTGRTSDPFILEDGTIIYGSYFNQLFFFKEWVQSFQIVQEEYKTVRINIVPQGEINSYEQSNIEEQIRLVMGRDCAIMWNIVDEIPKTTSGKHLYRISLVWRDLYQKSS